MNKTTLLISMTALILAGCGQPVPSDLGGGRLANNTIGLDAVEDVEEPSKWEATINQETTPEGADPADYGARPDGAYWQDTIVQAKSYELAAGAVITTHTHGIVILATDTITIHGTVDVRGLGAPPGEPGYAATRAATLALYQGYGETDQETGEPRLWGAGGDSCPGGGYIILNAPSLVIEGTLDAGSECGQAGIVILEGTVTGAGAVTASQVIRRGAA